MPAPNGDVTATGGSITNGGSITTAVSRPDGGTATVTRGAGAAEAGSSSAAAAAISAIVFDTDGSGDGSGDDVQLGLTGAAHDGSMAITAANGSIPKVEYLLYILIELALYSDSRNLPTLVYCTHSRTVLTLVLYSRSYFSHSRTLPNIVL
jgi:hypothetical protein